MKKHLEPALTFHFLGFRHIESQIMKATMRKRPYRKLFPIWFKDKMLIL